VGNQDGAHGLGRILSWAASTMAARRSS
jgi:hypothetical protein